MSAVTIDELKLAEEPSAWRALGFDVQGNECSIGGVRVSFAAGGGRGIVGWSLRALQSTELDGLPTERSKSPTLAPLAGEHPSGVAAIDHIVVISPALDRSVQALCAAGLQLRRVREEPTPAGAPRQAFFRLGSEILEVVQEPQAVLERRGGAERPAHFWGLALLAPDIERTAAAFGAAAGEIRPAVQPGRRIATVDRAAGLGIPIALMSPAERTQEVR